ncbi:MAG: histidine--tRNA ligase [Infirmifilum sp.]
MSGVLPLRPPRGTRDRMPEESLAKREVCERIRRVFELYGYGEVETPAFEHLEVLVAKAGEEVVEQIYNFKDKAGRDLGLRFELTTPIARIVASKLEMPRPIRFYYIQPVWRYEEPQRGRLREFWQAGVELIGVPGPAGDAEVIAMASQAVRAAGLEHFEVRLSHRAVVEDLLQSSGIPSSRLNEALRALDKMDKRGSEYVAKELSRLGASREKAEEVLSQLSTSGLEVEVKSEGGKEGVEFLKRVLDILSESYGVQARVDFSIVRGLGYYTGLVFEVKTSLTGEIGSVAGGGRYDDLISSLGGPKIPATGMAIGVDRLLEVLAEEGKLPQRVSLYDVAVIPVGESFDMLLYAIRVAETIRRECRLRTIVEYETKSISKTLEKAAKRGARFAVFIGEKEFRGGKVTIRNLEKWTEATLGLEEAVKLLTSNNF